MATGSSSTLRKVSFSLGLKSNSLTLGTGQTVKYDTVLTNDGNEYDDRTGVFTCPVAGTYMFIVDSLFTPGIMLHLNVNKTTVGILHVSNLHEKDTSVQISRTVIVKLKLGDHVKVEKCITKRLHSPLLIFRIFRNSIVLTKEQSTTHNNHFEMF